MALYYLYPDGTDSSAWGGTYQDIDDPFGSPDTLTTYIPWNGANDSEARFTMSAMPTVASIVSAQLYLFLWGQEATVEIGGLVRSGGTTTYETYVAQNNQWKMQLGAKRTLNPTTGLAWTVADLNALIAGVRARDTGGSVGSAFVSQLVVEVDAVSLPLRLGAARHRGSVEQHLRGRSLPYIKGSLGLMAGDRAPLTQAAWEHYAGATVKDAGFGIRPWERRLAALLESTLNLDNFEVSVKDFDLRRFLVHYRDTMQSEDVPSTFYQGVLRLDPGAGRVFTRASRAWIQNPASAKQGIVQFVGIAIDQEKLAQLGASPVELLEPARTNYALRSSYVNGTTGITAGGGSTITADTTEAHLLFETTESPNSLKFVAGSPHVADGTAAHPVTAAFAANDRITVSDWHKDDGGGQMAIRIQRSGGGSDYWNDSTGAWAAGPINNLMPLSATIYGRWVSKLIDVGAGTPTITGTLVQPSGGTAGRINRNGHLQIELGRSATGPIITTTAPVTRAVDVLKIENFTGKPVYDPARGTAYVKVTPNFNSADLAAGVTQTVFLAYKDASNYDWLFYDQATAAWIFRRRLAGVNYNATFAQAVTRFTAYMLVPRWTGTDAEEDLAPYTLSVFLNGVKGTDAVPAGTWTPGASEYLYIGTDPADMAFEQFIVRPFVYADLEMVDQP